MTDRDELDPADWLAQQFGEEPEPVVPAAPQPPAAPAPPVAPVPPVLPPVAPPPAAPPAPLPPLSDPIAAPAPQAGAPFQWGLTPGADPTPPVEPPAPQPPAPQPPIEPADAPTQAFTFSDLPSASQPPVAPPVVPPGQDLETVAFDATKWLAAPVDPAIEGVTEVIEAELVGLATPEGEGVQTSAIDNLFGATQFQEYNDLAIIPPLPPRAEKGARPPMPRAQKILLWVAGGLLAILALIGLFQLGVALSDRLAPAPVASESPSPIPSPSLTALPVGPVAPGEHQWNALLGGECLAPWESAWQDSYTVVDCATPHPAQMIFRGTFDDAPDVAYPGVEELQKRINLLCTPTTVIDYSKAGMLSDIQVSASFAADETDWSDGNRTFFCFVNRSSGQDMTESVAVPQVPAAPVVG